MSAITAHIVETVPAEAIAAGTVALVCATVGFAGWLLFQHHLVKYGRLRVDRIGQASAMVLALVVGAAALPGSAASQDREIPVGLPDLISDPPFIWFDKTIELADGSIAMVMSFDGYLRNGGAGVLELFGNPQEPGGVKQRWWDGEDWIEVASPRVIYETTDGHNHFHLMAAAEYELWNAGRTEKVGDASKVGFCLLDSEQRTPAWDEFYDINTYNYCEADNPDTEVLRMGITPGWVDLYDANTTLQWVDVSTTQPGWYWVGAIIDPEDQIVESDETNNGLVFSENLFAVTGAVARPLAVQPVGEPIELRADLIGTVGDVVWKITSGPSNGFLDVPVGVDLSTDTVQYTPGEGFTGTDSFTVAARDLASPFPLVPAEVTIQVEAATAELGEAANDDVLELADDLIPASLDVREWERVELDFAALVEVPGSDPADLSWYAANLPAGLRIDPSSGSITGVPALSNPGLATITVVTPAGTASFDLPWTVTRPASNERGLDQLNDMNTPYMGTIRQQIGRRLAEASYEATGLPEGTSISPNVPLLAGSPTEVGDFDVEVTATVDGEIIDSTSFTWTVRPAAVPAFPL